MEVEVETLQWWLWSNVVLMVPFQFSHELIAALEVIVFVPTMFCTGPRQIHQVISHIPPLSQELGHGIKGNGVRSRVALDPSDAEAAAPSPSGGPALISKNGLYNYAEERRRYALALAHLMMTDRLCSISRITAAASRPCLTAVAVASCFQTARDSRAHAPEVSATIGRKVMPASVHWACVLSWLRLVSQYSLAAVRAFAAALPTIPCRCGAVMAKSSAAGRPWVQVGR